MHLSPEVARKNLGTVYREEKGKLTEVIALIAVIRQRKDYLEAGYSCMRDFCMGWLKMSMDEAYRRIQVAEAAQRCPGVFECLEDGRLGVTTASVLAPHLTPETAGELLAAAAFRTKDEIVRMLAERSRRRAAAPVTTPVTEPAVESSSTSLAPVQVTSLADLCGVAACDSAAAPLAPAQVENARRGRVTTCETGSREVRLTLTDEEHDDLSAAMDLDAHAVPSGDPALVYARAMKHYRAHLERKRLGTKPGAAVPAGVGRGLPKALKRLVWERDGGRCAFLGTDGHRCGETRQLEIDHITPVAMGGEATLENLRVLCRAHNQYEAERLFGKEHVQRKRELARQERAKKKAAAKAERERERARKAAQPGRDAALRGERRARSTA
jgi:hypothetical protein